MDFQKNFVEVPQGICINRKSTRGQSQLVMKTRELGMHRGVS